jgi:hypothetical protein
MIRDGYYASYRGVEYEASPDGERMRLYSAYAGSEGAGFEQVAPSRFVKLVDPSELDGCWYVFSLCTWRGEVCRALYEQGEHIRLEYVGGKAPVADRLGLEFFDHGVYQGWALQNEVQDLREERLDL